MKHSRELHYSQQKSLGCAPCLLCGRDRWTSVVNGQTEEGQPSSWRMCSPAHCWDKKQAQKVSVKGALLAWLTSKHITSIQLAFNRVSQSILLCMAQFPEVVIVQEGSRLVAFFVRVFSFSFFNNYILNKNAPKQQRVCHTKLGLWQYLCLLWPWDWCDFLSNFWPSWYMVSCVPSTAGLSVVFPEQRAVAGQGLWDTPASEQDALPDSCS